ncbi:hypothetical protein DFH09DRAFT_330143 [Mycena vulgaris]|nr:hypothetical protein DFH09DRAFT_330143 [Mycena vulgaris]
MCSGSILEVLLLLNPSGALADARGGPLKTTRMVARFRDLEYGTRPPNILWPTRGRLCHFLALKLLRFLCKGLHITGRVALTSLIAFPAARDLHPRSLRPRPATSHPNLRQGSPPFSIQRIYIPGLGTQN